MATNSTQSLFYRDKPIFGLDIGFNTIKALQVDTSNKAKKSSLVGYGVNRFDEKAIKDGVIIDFESIAKSALELFSNNIVGSITTKRVAATIPAAKAYSRVMTLPSSLSRKELAEAVQLEAAQYIPIPLDELYLDYEVVNTHDDQAEVLVVAAPRDIVDSYMKLFAILGLEVCSLETTTSAASRIISIAESSNDIPTILIDLGSLSVDLTVYDQNLVVNGAIPGGGDDFSTRISEKLGITKAEANSIKTKYGLGVSKHQKEIREALKPQLDSLIKEVRRVVRYYEERTSGRASIGQIITMGGGSNMPGLADYLTDNLRIATRLCDFWRTFDNNGLQIPSDAEKSLYVTVAGAAVIRPEEIWK